MTARINGAPLLTCHELARHFDHGKSGTTAEQVRGELARVQTEIDGIDRTLTEWTCDACAAAQFEAREARR